MQCFLMEQKWIFAEYLYKSYNFQVSAILSTESAKCL